ncbi:hypothetical protein [Maribacter sp. 2210JD10-5]|uniref:hypothetical protein n=1 Tax=Maribacter sp. 2210JD10-5 TaxID=3386272 RepID=UPI0039BCDB2B
MQSGSANFNPNTAKSQGFTACQAGLAGNHNERLSGGTFLSLWFYRISLYFLKISRTAHSAALTTSAPQNSKDGIRNKKTGGNGTEQQGANRNGTENRNPRSAAKWTFPCPRILK